MSTRICLFGPTGSGKSTIARHLASRYGGEVIGVAEPLHRLQELIYGFLGMHVAGQDGELLQFLAQKIEREQPGWLGRTVLRKVLASTSPLVLNDDCRLNSYAALDSAGFVFVRVRTAPAEMAHRQRRDHTEVRADHPVEQGFERFRTDHELDNSGPLDRTLAVAGDLVERLMHSPQGVTRR
jgi:energy-coupling factor transporter ATP-binding protein EcfA2